jgi:threonine/homoserine/homoserine lactone efflux protein
VAGAGVAGFALWKVASVLLLPLLGTLLGFLFMIVKVGLIVGLVWLAIWFFRRGDRGREPPQPSEPAAE